MNTQNKNTSKEDVVVGITKGKWEANTMDKCPFTTYIETTENVIAQIDMGHYSTSDNTIEDCLKRDYENNSRVLANAKLIAAAPELLEALKTCREWYDKHGKDYEIGLPNCFIKAKEAINKATL